MLYSIKTSDLFADIFAVAGSEKKGKAKKKTEKPTKSKTIKNQVTEGSNSPNIFDDPLNALGGD